MKRTTLAVAAVLVASFAVAEVASAQKYIWIGGAAAMPIGDSKDGLKTGYMGDVGFGLPMNDRLDVHLGVLFGNNKHKVGNGSTDLLAGSIGLGYSLTSGSTINPYVLGSVGMMRADGGGPEAETEFMFQGGGGVSGDLSPNLGWWIEARYLQSGSGNTKLTLMPIAGGISIRFGS